jgi:hypothetical protein
MFLVGDHRGRPAMVPIRSGVATIQVTHSDWPRLRARIGALGLRIEEAEDAPATQATFVAPPGWNAAAPNGKQLYQYQREGVQFAVERNCKVIFGDEMGVGKTAEAIATAVATGKKRILVVAPATVKSVWRDEIKGWAAPETVIADLSDQFPDNGWLVMSYDQLVAKDVWWACANAVEEKCVRAFLHPERKDVKEIGKKVVKFRLTSEIAMKRVRPQLTAERAAKWAQTITRLRGSVLKKIKSWKPDMLIIDESHRVKNPNAKRTRALRDLGKKCGSVLMLTGTPLRNRVEEIAELVEIIDPAGAAFLRQNNNAKAARDVLSQAADPPAQSRRAAAAATANSSADARDVRRQTDPGLVLLGASVCRKRVRPRVARWQPRGGHQSCLGRCRAGARRRRLCKGSGRRCDGRTNHGTRRRRVLRRLHRASCGFRRSFREIEN